MTKRKLFQELASVLQARRNCAKVYEAKDAQDWGENEIRAKEWYDKHGERLDKLVYNYLPSGSGIDSGTKLDEDACKPGKLVFTFGYHHMNEYGMYDGWTDHKCVVTPSFDPDGIDLHITGRDRNQVKEHLYDVYHQALTQEIDINAYETSDEEDEQPSEADLDYAYGVHGSSKIGGPTTPTQAAPDAPPSLREVAEQATELLTMHRSNTDDAKEDITKLAEAHGFTYEQVAETLNNL